MWGQINGPSLFSQMNNSANTKTKKYFKDNAATGLYQQFDPKTGKLKQQGKFQNGQEVGIWKVFDQDGDQVHYTFNKERVGALCHDGTTSRATGRGACSWHGGVAQWLYENVKCKIGGTGKHMPLEKRVESLKQQIKTKFKITKIGLELDQEIYKLVFLLNQKNSKLIEQVQSANSKIQSGQKQVNIAKEKLSFLTNEIKDLQKKYNQQQSELKLTKEKLINAQKTLKSSGKEGDKLLQNKNGQKIEEKQSNLRQNMKNIGIKVQNLQKIPEKAKTANIQRIPEKEQLKEKEKAVQKKEVQVQKYTQKLKGSDNKQTVYLIDKQTQKIFKKSPVQQQLPQNDLHSELSGDWQSDYDQGDQQDDDYSEERSKEQNRQEEQQEYVDLIKQLLEKMNLK